MSYQPMQGGFDLQNGVVGGLAAFATGLAMTVVVVVFGLHPDRGIWQNIPDIGLLEYLALHMIIHIPSYSPAGTRLRGELLLYTILVIYILVTAGFLIARRSEDGGGLGHGASIAAGYVVPVVIVAVLIAQNVPVTLSQLFAPTLVVGVVYPAVFGGMGGAIANLV